MIFVVIAKKINITATTIKDCFINLYALFWSMEYKLLTRGKSD
ncbi:hypothetical protein [Escherichia coli ISC7]|uniref:Uncharacterized protein n=1 Tax=Escherichia coli ISC7 TaxID=1432555 RepID=W1F7X5_ECOLX|nr:hypothetical protein [Escherichia coli ISC7]